MAVLRRKTCGKFKNCSIGCIKMFHSIVKFESLKNRCPICNQNMDYSHVCKCMLKRIHKNSTVNQEKSMYNNVNIVSSMSNLVLDCVKMLLGLLNNCNENQFN